MDENNLTELAKRLRPLLMSVMQGVSQNVVNAGEGPGIDVVESVIGLGGDTILVYHVDGNPASEYAFSETGIRDALAAAVSGDTVILPAGTIPLSGEVSVIASGSINVARSTGTTISGLTVGKVYTIEATGGPWHTGVEPIDQYAYNLDLGGGVFSGILGLVASPAPGAPGFHLDLPTGATSAGAVDSYLARCQFIASATNIRIRVNDAGDWSNNTGSLGYSLVDQTGTLAIPSGVEIVGLGANSIIDGDIINNGILTNLEITGNISGTGRVRMVSNGSQEIFNRPVSMALRKIVNLADPTENQDAATKAYVDLHGGGSEGWFNVKSYGATGDGTTDDTAAITSAIAAIPPAGGVLYFPPGTYVTSGGFTLAYPTLILGAGSGNILGDAAVTQVNCTSATAVLFTVNSRKALFRDIALKNTAGSTPSAGAGIQVTSAYIHQRVDYEAISVYGFYINIDVQVGGQWTMHNVFVLDPVLYGLKIQNTVVTEAGDWQISDTNFNSVDHISFAAIRIESGAGGKITNVKINGAPPGHNGTYQYGISTYLASGVYCTVFLLSNSSIEGWTEHAVSIHTAATAITQLINIVGNELGTGVLKESIVLLADGATGLKDINIIGNQLFVSPGGTKSAISLTNVTNVTIGLNTVDGYSSELSQTGCTNVKLVGSGGTVTSVATGTGLSGGPITTTGTIALADTAVTPGSYTNADITVDAQGRITAAANGTGGTGSATGGLLASNTSPITLLTNEAEDDFISED